ncbi:response regulator receiver protein [Chthoniobacter flavus Ellin428]|uniref:Response regulator receiver protein n=1 Tax=Chthoniobacter flavus Ellin428 TaxID=497964 RepID=B4D947_9BACT|nr:response regulator [Chthoniobacter flavus]EDY17092.1 response regulator receiver protein [Chthoniobacter flavus Ellin428]TCO86142.1 response regulator receiver domain-containing protein [Chthoniobacter flavus]
MKRLAAAKSLIRIPRLVAGCVRSLRPKSRRAVVEKKSARKKRILLVDDESALTHICKLMLERTDDFVVEEENLGMRALSTARKFRPDVIFLDIRLPDKDGHAIAAELHSDPELRDVPIVFWSGTIRHRQEIIANAHGCWPTLPKPFSHDELTELAANPSYR